MTELDNKKPVLKNRPSYSINEQSDPILSLLSHDEMDHMSMGGDDMMGMGDMNTTLGLSHETFNQIDIYQYGFAILVDIFILSAYSVHFYRWFKYPDRRPAFAIFVNMVVWAITALCNMVYSINSVFAYGKEEMPALPIFWLGNLYFSGIIAICLSVFLLMVDRCTVLLFPTRAPNSPLRNSLTLILVTLEYLIFIVVFYLYEFPTKKVAQCSVIDCVAASHAETINATKVVYGLLNTALAMFFGFLLCRYNNARRVKQNNTRKANFIVALTVILQIGFNFVPSLINYISHKLSTNHNMTSNSAGPLVSTLSQLDGLFTAMLYMTMLVNRRHKNSKQMLTTKTVIEKMPPATTSNCS